LSAYEHLMDRNYKNSLILSLAIFRAALSI
jgi:hypothetical protein